MARIRISNEEKAKILAAKIAAQVKRNTGKGLKAAIPFLASRVKETLSVPAPRTAIRGQAMGKKKGPILGYKATTRATPGAPPRKLSGRLRTSVTHNMISDLLGVVGSNARSVPTQQHPLGFNYPRYHEAKESRYLAAGKHQWLLPTWNKWKRDISKIIGKAVKLGFE